MRKSLVDFMNRIENLAIGDYLEMLPLPEGASNEEGRLVFGDLFPGFDVEWVPVFGLMDADVRVSSVSYSDVIPDMLEETFVLSLNGEPGLFCYNRSLERALVSLINGEAGFAGERIERIVFNYLFGRCLVSLSKSWCFKDEPLSARYSDNVRQRSFESSAAVVVTISVDGQEEHCWFGLGPLATEMLTAAHSQLSSQGVKNSAFRTGRFVELRLSLFPVYFTASQMIDILEEKSSVSLGKSFSPNVNLITKQGIVAQGELLGRGERLVVSVSNVYPAPRSYPNKEGQTCISIELGRTRVEENELASAIEMRGLLDTTIGVSSAVDLVVGQEVIARGNLGIVGDELVVAIVGRDSSSEV